MLLTGSAHLPHPGSGQILANRYANDRVRGSSPRALRSGILRPSETRSTRSAPSSPPARAAAPAGPRPTRGPRERVPSVRTQTTNGRRTETLRRLHRPFPQERPAARSPYPETIGVCVHDAARRRDAQPDLFRQRVEGHGIQARTANVQGHEHHRGKQHRQDDQECPGFGVDPMLSSLVSE